MRIFEINENFIDLQDMRVKIDNFKIVRGEPDLRDGLDSGRDARSRLNERFRMSSGMKSRLGDKHDADQPEDYDSGDSLERDTGADLGKYLWIFFLCSF